MYLGLKNVNKNHEKNYSDMTTEERINLKRRIMQDALNFSQSFSYSNFVNYQYLSHMYAKSTEELKCMENVVKEIRIDSDKKKELFMIARQKIPLFYLPLNNMYNEGELKYFENCIIPYVNKQEEIKELQKCLFNAYQNYIIYNDIFELWMGDMDSLDKSIIFEKYKNKAKYQGSEMQEERREKVHLNKIDRIKRRIRRHIYKDNNNLNETKENTLYNLQSERTKNASVNFDDWL
ncbi:conserved Plasmodium protein, unknown function [Plasmodium ovale wallikeri]|uniref:Uncharacterized protein n=2 Tax=Plasmodium ovale TaxID=36330 RepID=A0A1A8ZI58_PLAOA|nr:conserved Plasmodium protein, unknown function [Plasmodium ovale wallikeri]SBT43983.1 conserved Plasmodium protein, unknown function [Plasmodium ovale wallikeri]SBT77962.1 conserved Plasmodium protein, unknown function [Plasmodium ovale]